MLVDVVTVILIVFVSLLSFTHKKDLYKRVRQEIEEYEKNSN